MVLVIQGNDMKAAYIIFGILLSNLACAQGDVVVNAIRMPAWIERGGERNPVTPGMELREGDVLITGTNGRLLLKSADGSDIKLGQEAQIKLSGLENNRLETNRTEKSIFSLVLDVTKGAFRFTTSALGRLKERNVKVKIATATLGIRGTDVWGKDDKSTAVSVVCLIEGKISVTGADQKEFVMDQPLSFYKMPKGVAALPVASVEQEQLIKWAQETEIANGQGAVRKGGKWKLNLMTIEGQQKLLEAYDELRAAGYDVGIVPLEANQFRLRITNLPSKAEAEALSKQMIGMVGISAPKVTR